MNIKEIARQRVALTQIEAFRVGGNSKRFAGLALCFEGYPKLYLTVETRDDSLIWVNSKDPAYAVDKVEDIFPSIKKAYGLFLTWVWEMENHQGYFDALQLELVDGSLKSSVIIQFKVAASAINLFEVLPARGKT
jgi:hypothetical protein